MADTIDRATAQSVLDCPLRDDNDSGATTVRGYLAALLDRLWDEGEGFSGKRPFGNSDWEYDLYQALAVAGYVTATLDEDGSFDIADSQRWAADALVIAAISELGHATDEVG